MTVRHPSRSLPGPTGCFGSIWAKPAPVHVGPTTSGGRRHVLARLIHDAAAAPGLLHDLRQVFESGPLFWQLEPAPHGACLRPRGPADLFDGDIVLVDLTTTSSDQVAGIRWAVDRGRCVVALHDGASGTPPAPRGVATLPVDRSTPDAFTRIETLRSAARTCLPVRAFWGDEPWVCYRHLLWQAPDRLDDLARLQARFPEPGLLRHRTASEVARLCDVPAAWVRAILADLDDRFARHDARSSARRVAACLGRSHDARRPRPRRTA